MWKCRNIKALGLFREYIEKPLIILRKKELISKINDLNDSLQTITQSCEGYKSEILRYKTINQEQNDTITRLKEEQNEQKSIIKSQKEEIESLKRNLEKLQAENEHNIKIIEKLKIENDNNIKIIKELKTKVQRLNNQGHRVENNNSLLEEIDAKIHSLVDGDIETPALWAGGLVAKDLSLSANINSMSDIGQLLMDAYTVSKGIIERAEKKSQEVLVQAKIQTNLYKNELNEILSSIDTGENKKKRLNRLIQSARDFYNRLQKLLS